MASIKILGGSVPKQTASYLFGILTIKDNYTKPQTYVSKEAVKHIEKVSEDKKSITFKLTLKDGTHFVGNAPRKIYDKLVVDQVLAEQSNNDKDGKIVSTVTPKAKPQPQPLKTPKPLINVENELNSAIRAFSWIGAIILLVLCFSALDEQRNVAGAMFITASFLLMPPMKQYLSKTILDKRGWIVSLFFIIGFILMLTPQNPNSKNLELAAQAQVESTSNQTDITKNKLVIDFGIESSKETKQVGGLSLDERLYLKSFAGKEDLLQFLLDRHEDAKAKGYKKIFLYLYPSQEATKSALSWVSQLEWIEVNNKEPKVYFNDEQFSQITSKPLEDLEPNIPQPPAPRQRSAQERMSGFLTGQDWYSQTAKSVIDDSTNVTLRRQAFTGFTNAYGQKIIPVLTIRCHENKTDVIVNWDVYLGLGSTTMTTRLDTEKATTTTWSISSDNKAVFARSPVNFVKAMLDNSLLLTRITPYGESPETVEFGLNGLPEEIEPLRKACGW